MTLKVIGAGLGRTGTMSLKLALETLLQGKCYHMAEVFQHLEDHVPVWHAAARGEAVDWPALFDGYVAAVDEPTSILWKPIAEAFPEALIILSVRDADSWWRSANDTILKVKQSPPDHLPPERLPWHRMIMDLYPQVHPNGVTDPALTKESSLAHIDRVRREAPRERLLVWQVSDGWKPLCEALNLPIPDLPFPSSNSTAEFRARMAPAK